MNNILNIEYKLPEGYSKELADQLKKADEAYNKLVDSGLSMTGWIDYPNKITDNLYNQILEIADGIRNDFSAVVIVGIGGSFLGARAALDFVLKKSKDSDMTGPEIYFAGINISTDYHEQIIRKIKNENIALIIISKSGTTTETLVAGNIFMEYIEEKYGKDGKRNRIFMITDPQKGMLRKLADEEGYASLPVPEGIGGRFSVLTPVGLLPMAIAGIDIREIIDGAVSAMDNDLIKKAKTLAATRNLLEDKGYSVELFADFDPYMTYLIQWIKQLYGESEGKEGKGMLPVNLEYSRDLHSLGQFVQEGRQIFAETFIGISEDQVDTDQVNDQIKIPQNWGISERDLTMTELNNAAKKGAMAAHFSDGIPITDIELPGRDAYSFGQAVYFFQMSCAIRGLMMGINPFDQPGVEKYKHEMGKNLK